MATEDKARVTTAVASASVGTTTKRVRPEVLHGVTYRSLTPLGDAYITINKTEDGQPFELFLEVGKCGSDVYAISEGFGRLISYILRNPGTVVPMAHLEAIANQFEGIGGRTQTRVGHDRVLSLPDAIAKTLRFHLAQETGKKSVTTGVPADICDECHNNTMIHAGGCSNCTCCGKSKCS